MAYLLLTTDEGDRRVLEDTAVSVAKHVSPATGRVSGFRVYSGEREYPCAHVACCVSASDALKWLAGESK